MTQSLMCTDYTKSFRVKPQIDRRFHSKSYRIILNNPETSSEMLQVVSNVRDNLFEMFSIFYHSLYIQYHEILSNFMIFGLRLLFIEFKNRSSTGSRSCFLNKMFENSFHIIGQASIWAQQHEYQFCTHFCQLFESLAVQILLNSKNYLKCI